MATLREQWGNTDTSERMRLGTIGLMGVSSAAQAVATNRAAGSNAAELYANAIFAERDAEQSYLDSLAQIDLTRHERRKLIAQGRSARKVIARQERMDQGNMMAAAAGSGVNVNSQSFRDLMKSQAAQALTARQEVSADVRRGSQELSQRERVLGASGIQTRELGRFQASSMRMMGDDALRAARRAATASAIGSLANMGAFAVGSRSSGE